MMLRRRNGSKKKKKQQQSRLKMNAMLAVFFFDCQAVVHFKYFNQLIDSFLCFEAISKQSKMWADNSWISHDDNAPLHRPQFLFIFWSPS